MTPPGPIDRVFGAIVPRAVDSIDMNEVIGQVDINHLVSQVDVDGIIQRVDLDALLTRIDIDALLARIDVDALIKRVDVDGLIQQLDVDSLMNRVDLDALMARVDLDALMARAHIDEIVSNASRGVTTRLIDAVRRQLVGLDALLIGVVLQVFRRRPREQSSVADGTVTGRVAGGASRLTAFLIDAAVLSISYGLLVALLVFMVGLFSGDNVDPSKHSWLWVSGYLAFGFTYYWTGLAITGRSIGKGLVGLRVVRMSGDPISPWRAAVRTIVYPFSFILGLGLIPIVVGKQRRALHDFAAGDQVLYDWGDRPAEMPAPLSAWVRRRVEADPAVPPMEVALVKLTESEAAPTQ